MISQQERKFENIIIFYKFPILGFDDILPSKKFTSSIFHFINVSCHFISFNILIPDLVIWGAGCFFALLTFIVENIKTFCCSKKKKV